MGKLTLKLSKGQHDLLENEQTHRDQGCRCLTGKRAKNIKKSASYRKEIWSEPTTCWRVFSSKMQQEYLPTKTGLKPSTSGI